MFDNELVSEILQQVYDARKNNLKVPIWRNNRVEYIDPAKDFEDETGKT